MKTYYYSSSSTSSYRTVYAYIMEMVKKYTSLY